MCEKPILRQPDYSQPFFLATDDSAYGVGAVLLQEGDKHPRKTSPTKHPIAYYSATFTPTKRNYDIYKQELLAVKNVLAHWRPHLAGTITPITILTDHTNLTYWKAPRKVNRRVARWFAKLQEYNFKIQHVPGKLHTSADLLSRPPVTDQGINDNEDVTLLCPDLFIRLSLVQDPNNPWWTMEKNTQAAQDRHPHTVKDWIKKRCTTLDKSTCVPNLKHWRVNGRIAIPDEPRLKQEILHQFHGLPTRGHHGQDATIQAV
jgi:hypothetical protein